MFNFDRKSLAGIAGALTLAMGLAGGASAAVLTTLDASSAQNAGNTAHLYAAAYDASLPPGASWTAAPTLRLGDIGGITKSPFSSTPLVGVNTYWSTGPSNPASPAVLSFGAGTKELNMLWGSVDDYNTVTFTTTSGGTVVSGTAIAGMIGSPPCAAPANFECVALLSFTLSDAGETFVSATFSSVGANALEFAFIPLPAAGFLLLGGLGALGLVSRRRKAAA